MSAAKLFGNNFIDAAEQIEPSETKIEGKVPDWLKGDLLRACPGRYQLSEDFRLNHFYDGLAMIYKFSFTGNKVTFSKRFLETDAYKRATTVGKPIYTEFGTRSYPDPSKGFFSRMLSNFDPSSVTDNSGVNIFKMGSELFAASDTCYFRRFEGRTLATKEKVDLSKLCGINFASCHVQDGGNGKYFLVGTVIMGAPKYLVIEITPSKKDKGTDVWTNNRVVASVPARWKASCSYLHSFAMTEDFVVFLEQPQTASTLKIATAQIKGKCFHDCMDWTPEEGTRIIVVKKSTGEVKSHYFLDEPFYNVHYANAFENGNHVIVDVLATKDSKSMAYLFLDELKNKPVPESVQHVKRLVIPFINKVNDALPDEELVKIPNCKASAKRTTSPAHGDHIRISGTILSNICIDYTCINDSYSGKPYKFVYGNGGFFADASSKNAIVKLNVDTGKHLLWRETAYQYPSEPTFVPRPNSSGEDDGVIMFGLTDTRPDMPHYLVILDARSMEEMGRVETISPIPNGHHGIFVSK